MLDVTELTVEETDDMAEAASSKLLLPMLSKPMAERDVEVVVGIVDGRRVAGAVAAAVVVLDCGEMSTILLALIPGATKADVPEMHAVARMMEQLNLMLAFELYEKLQLVGLCLSENKTVDDRIVVVDCRRGDESSRSSVNTCVGRIHCDVTMKADYYLLTGFTTDRFR